MISYCLSQASESIFDEYPDIDALERHLNSFDISLENGHSRITLRKAIGHLGNVWPAVKSARLPAFAFNVKTASVVIGAEQFREALRLLRLHLHSKGLARERIDEIVLIACLSFRLGLRTSEARLIEIRDVHVASGEIDLLVRSNSRYETKSDAGRRKLPLEALMPADEVALFRKILEARLREGNPHSLLFSFEDKKNSPSPKWISGALKLATGNEDAVQHSLRHSFGTWLLLRLFEASDPSSQIRSMFPAGVIPDPLTKHEWKRIIGGIPGPNADLLHCVQKRMGHARPQTTVRNYIHCLPELFAAQALRAISEEDPVTDALLAKVAPLPRSTAYRLLSEPEGREALLSEAWAPLASGVSHPAQSPHEKELALLESRAKAVFLYRNRSLPIGEVAQLLRLSVADVTAAHSGFPEGASSAPPPIAVSEYVRQIYIERFAPLGPGDRAAVFGGLQDYLARCWKGRTSAVFTSCDEISAVRNILAAFAKLNVSPEFIVYGFEERVAIPTWARPVMKPGAKIQHIRASKRDSRALANWIGIRPSAIPGSISAHVGFALRRMHSLLSLGQRCAAS
jgi:hypothetical protein